MLSLVVLMMAQAAGSAIANNRVPDAALISKLESKIVMPKGAGPLSSYKRAYTEADINGKDTVVGQMISHEIVELDAKYHHQPFPPDVRRTLMNEITPAFDGGCAVLMVFYQVGENVAPMVICNSEGPH